MSIREEFAELVSRSDDVALDRAFGLVAQAVLGEGQDTTHALDDLAARFSGIDEGQLMEALFGSKLLQGDHVTYDEPTNSYLHAVLRRGYGIPLSLCVVAIEVGRRVGVNLLPIGMPGHVLVASATDRERLFDPFHGGTALDPRGARELYHRVTGLDVWSPQYLTAVSNRVVVMRLLTNLKSSYRRRHQIGALRVVMGLRSCFPELNLHEKTEFARLMRTLN
jgi:regulator of sirC expression with transglutaminase-like and TPR domain